MKFIRLALFCWFFYAVPSAAVLNIEIIGTDASALPIAIVPFEWKSNESRLPLEITDVVASDLERSGQFRAVPVDKMLERPHRGNDIKFENWRILEVENLLIGNVKKISDDLYIVEFQLFDVFKGRQLLGESLKVPADELRNTAHYISDKVYEELTGERGAFNTRIAYVIAEQLNVAGKIKLNYRLEISDTDGYNPQPILKSSQPILSPSWSPDGRQLAYVSFENNRSEIWVHSVFAGEREVIAQFKGINGAPVWSPDGKTMAVVSSHQGNADIYKLELSNKHIKKLTKSWSIDTEPVWTPDGKSLIYTSGRSGGPQVYQLDLASGDSKRLTFEGKYNASPVISPDGRTVAMVHAHRGKYQIAALDLKTGIFRILTDGRLDESPSFSPNGTMLLYASVQGDRGVLAAVSVDGRTRQRLAFSDGNIREPTWGPFPIDQH